MCDDTGVVIRIYCVPYIQTTILSISSFNNNNLNDVALLPTTVYCYIMKVECYGQAYIINAGKSRRIAETSEARNVFVFWDMAFHMSKL